MAKNSTPPKTLEEALADVHRTNHRLTQVVITFLIVVAGILSGIVYYQYQAINRFKALAEDTHSIGQQNHKLATDNQSIAKQNRSYTRCLATVFAQYTHDFVPVTIQNLDTCTTDSQSQATNDTSTGGTVPGTNSQQGSSSPNTNSGPSINQPKPGPSASSTPSNPQPAANPLLVSPVNNPILCNLNPAVVGCK